MDTYARRRLIAIFIAGIAVAGAALLYIWVAFTLHVVSTDPSGSTIPSTQQTVSVQFNQPLIDAQVTSISPDIGYSSSVKDATFTVKLGDTLSEGTVLTLDISAKSARATSDIHLSFTSAYVNFNQLSEAEQTQQIDSSDISNAYPMAGLVPRIDLGAPYYISYGEPARGVYLRHSSYPTAHQTDM